MLNRHFTFSKTLKEIDDKWPTREKYKQAISLGATRRARYGVTDSKRSSLGTGANLITSIHKVFVDPHTKSEATEYHAPVIDIDVPIQAIPSRTEGHYHLYIDRPMSPALYDDLLSVLVKCGLVERAFYDSYKAKGYTEVRVEPYIKHLKLEQEMITEAQDEMKKLLAVLDDPEAESEESLVVGSESRSDAVLF